MIITIIIIINVLSVIFVYKNIFFNQKITDSKSIGLRICLLLNRGMVNGEDMHYGYFTKKIKNPTFVDFKKAQVKYSNQIIKNIPKNIKSILDVGCGSGALAKKLLDHGYVVDCLSPDVYFSDIIKRNISSSNGKLYQTTFENLKITKKYDLILFSESFQYINMECAFVQINKYLKKGGYCLIADTFKRETCHISGGHRWIDFQTMINNIQNFREILKLDITKETAITYDFRNNILFSCILPCINLVIKYIYDNYPILTYIIKYVIPPKLYDKITKYKNETSAFYIKNKVYYILLYQSV